MNSSEAILTFIFWLSEVSVVVLLVSVVSLEPSEFEMGSVWSSVKP